MGCPKQCDQNKFSFTNMAIGTSSIAYKNKTTFWAELDQHYVTINEEYILFDSVAIISATGGSLGLTLGLSCYSVIWTGFEWLEAAFLRFKEK